MKLALLSAYGSTRNSRVVRRSDGAGSYGERIEDPIDIKESLPIALLGHAAFSILHASKVERIVRSSDDLVHVDCGRERAYLRSWRFTGFRRKPAQAMPQYANTNSKLKRQLMQGQETEVSTFRIRRTMPGRGFPVH
jgi:hypothetical protein